MHKISRKGKQYFLHEKTERFEKKSEGKTKDVTKLEGALSLLDKKKKLN